MVCTTLCILGAIIIGIYVFLTWNFDYWSKKGVNGPKPQPLVGNFPSLLTQKRHFAYEIDKIYKKYQPTNSLIGVYLLRVPQLIVCDPELVHEVLVTAFKHFHDNDIGKLIDPKKDPLIANNPFLLTGDAWKEQRALVTPGLTSSRIKVAYSIMQKRVCQKLCDYIEAESKMAPKDGINGRDLSLRFTVENVSDSVLGIEAKSFTKDALPIPKHIRTFTESNTIFMIYSAMVGIFPKLMKVFKMKFFPKESETFFINLMLSAFKLHKESKVDRQDFLSHLFSLKQKRELNEMELTSHCMTFLFDGMDTSSAVLSHCLLLLGREQELQEKLLKEVLKNSNENGEIEYENLVEMPYLDAFVHETLRMFPPGVWLQKVCTEPYEFKTKEGSYIRVDVDDTVLIPIYSFNNDPNYYEEPEKFKPERFLPENGGLKKYRDMKVSYGFGDGPRMCLGMRFALVQVKAGLSRIVQQFNVTINPKTKSELSLDPKGLFAQQDGGIWLDFKKRQ